ncbi:STAS domain-containing protein [Amycolatopsis sp. NPDC059657]|uniref:STAS domain-containing protein n=1 Tax=Amycolatopsis sp. NPDC059657 TaxID=3346899 RepID=UPI00366CC044
MTSEWTPSSADGDASNVALLQLTSYRRAEAVVIQAAGEVDVSTVDQLMEAVTVALATKPERVVLDLGAVRFVASCGLRELLRGHAAAVSDGIRFIVAATDGALRRSLEVTGLDHELETFDSVDAALAAN